MAEKFDGGICIRQRIVGSYRLPFIDLLAERCSGPVVLISGQSDTGDSVNTSGELKVAQWVKVENVRRGFGVFASYKQPELLEQLDQIKPTVFVSEASPRLTDIANVTRHLRAKNIPTLGWGAGTTDYWNRPLKRLRSLYRNRVLSHFDGMLCYGTLAQSQYQAIGFKPEDTFVLYNATVRQPDANSAASRPPCSPPIKILFIGGLLKTKSIDRLIEAAKLLQDDGKSLVVQIVGSGPEAENLQQLASKLNAPVEFLGRQTGEDLAAIAKASDLFVLPGLGGLAIQEAMSFGLPVIVTEADGTELDLVRDNGWITQKDNTQALADCIATAIKDPAELRRRGEESFRIVYEIINLDLMADRLIQAADYVKNRFASR
ncbi:glycosyltransferase family 4 protein [Mariniblastus sp.]|nr:glycosyltransferase family 4 protein [Mariniblastus sp.]